MRCTAHPTHAQAWVNLSRLLFIGKFVQLNIIFPVSMDTKVNYKLSVTMPRRSWDQSDNDDGVLKIIKYITDVSALLQKQFTRLSHYASAFWRYFQ